MTKQELKLKYSFLVLFLVLATGTVGYQVVQGWDWVDSLYMTVITLSTVGFREVHDLSPAGRLFTMFLVIFGVGSVAYVIKSGTQAMFEGELRNVLGRRKLKKSIGSLKGHYIVCGYGRMGRIVAKEFLSEGVPFVVIEGDQDVVAGVTDPNILIIHGDATLDATLEEAGIAVAKGIVSVLMSDADNLLVVLSARGMNEGIRIVARAGEEGVEKKLIRAGADKVVSPYQMGGIRIAHALLKPAVTDFLDLTVQDKAVDLELEQLRVPASSPLAGKTLTDSNIRKDFDVILVAIKRKDGSMVFNPGKDTVLSAGDTIIVLGERDHMEKLEAVAELEG